MDGGGAGSQDRGDADLRHLNDVLYADQISLGASDKAKLVQLCDSNRSLFSDVREERRSNAKSEMMATDEVEQVTKDVRSMVARAKAGSQVDALDDLLFFPDVSDETRTRIREYVLTRRAAVAQFDLDTPRRARVLTTESD